MVGFGYSARLFYYCLEKIQGAVKGLSNRLQSSVINSNEWTISISQLAEPLSLQDEKEDHRSDCDAPQSGIQDDPYLNVHLVM